MENKIINIWNNPPYINYSNDGFSASLKEFRVNSNKTAIIVCPGGGYVWKAPHEGDPICKMYNNAGINAYTLDYSIAPCHMYAPLSDAMRAIRYLRSIGYEKVAIAGFSAGGHLCCSASTLFGKNVYPKTDKIDELSCRPDAFISCYSVITFGKYTHTGSKNSLLGEFSEDKKYTDMFSVEKQVGKNTPPCFIWHTSTDDVVPVENAYLLAKSLQKHKVPYELHVYSHGCHGMGLAETYNDISRWAADSVLFLKNLGF